MKRKWKVVGYMLCLSMLFVACGAETAETMQTEMVEETEAEEQIAIDYFSEGVEVTRFKDITNYEEAFESQDVTAVHFDDVTLSVDEFILKSMESYKGVIEKLTSEHRAEKDLTGAITIYFSDFTVRYTPTYTSGEYCVGIAITIESRTNQCRGFYMECPDKNWGIRDKFCLYASYPNDIDLYWEILDIYNLDFDRLEGESIVGVWNGPFGNKQYILYNDNTGVILPCDGATDPFTHQATPFTYEELSEGYFAIYDENAVEMDRLILDEDYLFVETNESADGDAELNRYVRTVLKDDFSDPVAWEIINVQPVNNGEINGVENYELTEFEKLVQEIKADANAETTNSQDYLRGQWFLGDFDRLERGGSYSYSPMIGLEEVYFEQSTNNSYVGFTNDEFVLSFEDASMHDPRNLYNGFAETRNAIKVSGVYRIVEEGTYEDAENVSCTIEFVVTSISPENGNFHPSMYEGLHRSVSQSPTTLDITHCWYWDLGDDEECRTYEELCDFDFPESILKHASGTFGYRADGSYGYIEYDEPQPYYSPNISYLEFTPESTLFSEYTYMKVRSRIYGFDDMEPGKYIDDILPESEESQ